MGESRAHPARKLLRAEGLARGLNKNLQRLPKVLRLSESIRGRPRQSLANDLPQRLSHRLGRRRCVGCFRATEKVEQLGCVCCLVRRPTDHRSEKYGTERIDI